MLFGRLTRENQITELKRRQLEITDEIAHQELQTTDDLYTEAIRRQNISDLLGQRLRIGEQIQNLDTKVDIGAVAQARGAAAAIGAAASKGQPEQARVNGQQLSTQQQILEFLKNNAPGKNTVTFTQ